MGYKSAYKHVFKKLLKAYDVGDAAAFKVFANINEELDLEDQVFVALRGVDSGDNDQIAGAGSALAALICGDHELGIEQDSTLNILATTLAISVKFDTRDAACELVYQMFGAEKEREFELRLDCEMTELLVAHNARIKAEVAADIEPT